MKRFPTLTLIVKTYGLALGVFFIFRLILFLSQTGKVDLSEEGMLTIIQAFVMGIRFDVVISGYLLFFPALILFTFEIAKIKFRIVEHLIFWIINIGFFIVFAISASDIPYFNQFFSRFSVAAFQWIDSPFFVIKMIVQEPKYIIYLVPFIILIIVFYMIFRIIYFKKTEENTTHISIKIVVSLLFLGVMFVGIRGRIQKKSPIRVGTAYFCNNAFLNQLGLNPSFTLMRSYLDGKKEKNKPIQLMDDELAINLVQQSLQISQPHPKSPIARMILPDSVSINKPNVVIVIMESMSTAKMGRHGNPNHLTPFLDSLSYRSMYFENIYTAGKHTYNGIFGTLFSFPSLFMQHHLKDIRTFDGLATTLKELGYSTAYFTTHDGQFDNVEGFLHGNDFERVITQKEYPAKEVKTALGVPDDFMFRYAIPVLDEMHREGKPFFTTFMTASDHGPFYIPDYFTPKSTHIKDQIVEYADWSLGQFIENASLKEWYQNTIFVFIADHGAPLNSVYDISLNYHHTPLLFYSPAILTEPKSYDCIGGQIDLFPTLMGILRLPYINNTLGIDLINSSRPYIFINDDDKIGVLNHEHLLIFGMNRESKLYNYRNSDTKNRVLEFSDQAKSMEQYAKANMQVFQYMMNHNKLTVRQ